MLLNAKPKFSYILFMKQSFRASCLSNLLLEFEIYEPEASCNYYILLINDKTLKRKKLKLF